MLFVCGFDIGVDVIELQKFSFIFEQSLDQFCWVDCIFVDIGEGFDFRGQGDCFGVVWENIVVLGNQVCIVILLGGLIEFEEVIVFFLKFFGILWIWVDEDVVVIEGGDQFDLFGQQYVIIEYVIRYVVYIDDGEGFVLDIFVQFVEMLFDGFLGVVCCDVYFFVIVIG